MLIRQAKIIKYQGAYYVRVVALHVTEVLPKAERLEQSLRNSGLPGAIELAQILIGFLRQYRNSVQQGKQIGDAQIQFADDPGKIEKTERARLFFEGHSRGLLYNLEKLTEAVEPWFEKARSLGGKKDVYGKQEARKIRDYYFPILQRKNEKSQKVTDRLEQALFGEAEFQMESTPYQERQLKERQRIVKEQKSYEERLQDWMQEVKKQFPNEYRRLKLFEEGDQIKRMRGMEAYKRWRTSVDAELKSLGLETSKEWRKLQKEKPLPKSKERLQNRSMRTKMKTVYKRLEKQQVPKPKNPGRPPKKGR